MMTLNKPTEFNAKNKSFLQFLKFEDSRNNKLSKTLKYNANFCSFFFFNKKQESVENL